jgi:hypothetical protein
MVLAIILLEDKHKMLLHLSILCEVLWRNISDFYVNLRVEVAAVSRNRYGVEKSVDTHNILINAITFYVCLQTMEGVWE